MKKITFFILIFSIKTAYTQTISGVVFDTKNTPLIGATVLEINSKNGVVTGIDGQFTIKPTQKGALLAISYAGFQPDTIKINDNKIIQIVLKENTEELEEVVVSTSSTFMDNLSSQHLEVISEAELTKAACCNLSESFETNASVDVSVKDAITGAKTIQMLGLDGKYVQINRENIPNIRGLAGQHGLGFIPGTWIQSIDVGKGAGSVVNGYESMTGQLNIELKKPESSEKFYLNSYINSFGRLELNANHARKLNDQWSAAILLHADNLSTEIDQNDDGFMDLPKSRQINVMNRYKYRGNKMVGQLGINVLNEEKAGGQLGFSFGDDTQTSAQYGYVHDTRRLELFGKTGMLFPHKPYKGWGLVYSASHLEMKGGFGRNQYKGEETTLYGNVIFQNIIGNSFHQYKTGISLLYNKFDEIYADSIFFRKEVVPGWYYEYNYIPNERFTLVLGTRTDLHNLYGTYFTPRLHCKYHISDNTTVRLALGKGYRTPNLIMENSNILVSSRAFVVQESLEPEVSWNMGGSIVTALPLFDKKLNLTADYFYTSFQNQLIYDLDQNPNQINIYNLRGRAYAKSFQLEINYHLSEFINLKSAYKYYDVRKTINGALRQAPFISRNRFFLNVSYATKFDRWKLDGTLQWFGTKRLPDTGEKPEAFQREDQSSDYALVNLQISRGLKWGSIYLGSENLLDFTQENPIIDHENPFGEHFDASIVWAPIAGRMIYAGFRYKIK